MMRKGGGFSSAFQAVNSNDGTSTKARGAFSSMAAKGSSVVAPQRKHRPRRLLTPQQAKELLEELRSICVGQEFVRALSSLRARDWGAFRKREGCAKLLGITWKATLKKHGFSIDERGFPEMLAAVKVHRDEPGIRVVAQEVERQLGFIPGSLFGLTAGSSWKRADAEIDATAMDVEVLVRHAHLGDEIRVRVPASATMRQVKEAVEQQVAQDDVVNRCHVVKREYDGSLTPIADGSYLQGRSTLLVTGVPFFNEGDDPLRKGSLSLREATEFVNAFKAACEEPDVQMAFADLEKQGGQTLAYGQQMLVEQLWAKATSLLTSTSFAYDVNAMIAIIKSVAGNDYINRTCHEIERLCRMEAGSYLVIPEPTRSLPLGKMSELVTQDDENHDSALGEGAEVQATEELTETKQQDEDQTEKEEEEEEEAREPIEMVEDKTVVEAAPSPSSVGQATASPGQPCLDCQWIVVGGKGKGGILVRESASHDSAQFDKRLAAGSKVAELDISGNRLKYFLVDGTGPECGWVNIRVSGIPIMKRLSVPTPEKGSSHSPDLQNDTPSVGALDKNTGKASPGNSPSMWERSNIGMWQLSEAEAELRRRNRPQTPCASKGDPLDQDSKCTDCETQAYEEEEQREQEEEEEEEAAGTEQGHTSMEDGMHLIKAVKQLDGTIAVPDKGKTSLCSAQLADKDGEPPEQAIENKVEEDSEDEDGKDEERQMGNMQDEEDMFKAEEDALEEGGKEMRFGLEVQEEKEKVYFGGAIYESTTAEEQQEVQVVVMVPRTATAWQKSVAKVVIDALKSGLLAKEGQWLDLARSSGKQQFQRLVDFSPQNVLWLMGTSPSAAPLFETRHFSDANTGPETEKSLVHCICDVRPDLCSSGRPVPSPQEVKELVDGLTNLLRHAAERKLLPMSSLPLGIDETNAICRSLGNDLVCDISMGIRSSLQDLEQVLKVPSNSLMDFVHIRVQCDFEESAREVDVPSLMTLASLRATLLGDRCRRLSTLRLVAHSGADIVVDRERGLCHGSRFMLPGSAKAHLVNSPSEAMEQATVIIKLERQSGMKVIGVPPSTTLCGVREILAKEETGSLFECWDLFVISAEFVADVWAASAIVMLERHRLLLGAQAQRDARLKARRQETKRNAKEALQMAVQAREERRQKRQLLVLKCRNLCKNSSLCFDNEPDEPGAPAWVVVGGAAGTEETMSLPVYPQASMDSLPFGTRLTVGSRLENIEVVGNRFHYHRLQGDGPDFGWIDFRRDGMTLVEQEESDFEIVEEDFIVGSPRGEDPPENDTAQCDLSISCLLQEAEDTELLDEARSTIAPSMKGQCASNGFVTRPSSCNPDLGDEGHESSKGSEPDRKDQNDKTNFLEESEEEKQEHGPEVQTEACEISSAAESAEHQLEMPTEDDFLNVLNGIEPTGERDEEDEEIVQEFKKEGCSDGDEQHKTLHRSVAAGTDHQAIDLCPASAGEVFIVLDESATAWQKLLAQAVIHGVDPQADLREGHWMESTRIDCCDGGVRISECSANQVVWLMGSVPTSAPLRIARCMHPSETRHMEYVITHLQPNRLEKAMEAPNAEEAKELFRALVRMLHEWLQGGPRLDTASLISEDGIENVRFLLDCIPAHHSMANVRAAAQELELLLRCRPGTLLDMLCIEVRYDFTDEIVVLDVPWLSSIAHVKDVVMDYRGHTSACILRFASVGDASAKKFVHTSFATKGEHRNFHCDEGGISMPAAASMLDVKSALACGTSDNLEKDCNMHIERWSVFVSSAVFIGMRWSSLASAVMNKRDAMRRAAVQTKWQNIVLQRDMRWVKSERRRVQQELVQKIAPAHFDQEPDDPSCRIWIVVGGTIGDDKVQGILVRSGESLESKPFPTRLTTGSTLEELQVVGNRLHYKRLRGDGPDFGWVNIALNEKPLLELEEPEVEISISD